MSALLLLTYLLINNWSDFCCEFEPQKFDLITFDLNQTQVYETWLISISPQLAWQLACQQLSGYVTRTLCPDHISLVCLFIPLNVVTSSLHPLTHPTKDPHHGLRLSDEGQWVKSSTCLSCPIWLETIHSDHFLFPRLVKTSSPSTSQIRTVRLCSTI